MHAFSDFNWVQSWEEGSAGDSDNQMAPLAVAEESLAGYTEKRDMKTVAEKIELSSVSVTQAARQFNGTEFLVTGHILLNNFSFCQRENYW